MLSKGKVFATIAVSNLKKGKEFYGGTLGLVQVDETPAGVTYESGGGRLFIYEAPTAGTSQATCAAWTVDEVEATVNDLKTKGVTFEHYDLPGATREGDLHVMGSLKGAWFKDPDGNILSVANG